jgi:hypothetical protein
MSSSRVLACVLVLVLASVSNAQWSSDPAVNLPVADASGDQVQPKIAPTSDGGCYVSWFDSFANGFDVRVQKLDVTGKEVFAHNGVLVADLNQSSTTDYGLDVDASGNALLAFQDDSGGDLQITAAKVSPTGALLWGASGVQLTNTTDYVAAPEIAGTSDGGAVVAWTQNSTTRLQKLDAGGNALWGAGITLSPTAGSYWASDLHGTGADVILSFVHQTGGFYSPKHLLAQKFDPAGSLLWGASHVAVFDGGSLQMGNFPDFILDGSGGAVFSWYDASTLALQCYAQHVLANGTEAFPHNGSAVSTNATRVRVAPWAAFNPSTNETFVFWEEESSDQSQSGIYGQKLDAAGNRQWTNDGAVVVPVGSDGVMGARCETQGAGAFAFWLRSPAFGQDRLLGARLTGGGGIDIAPFYVASVVSQKSLPESAKSVAGYAILAWSDTRTDEGDILAQNVNPDGTLGTAGAGISEGSAEPAQLFLGTPSPNPTSGRTWMEYSSAGSGGVVLEIYDVCGRVVRTCGARSGAAEGTIAWDGRDETGARVPTGVYFARLTNGEAARTTKVILVR